MKLIYLLHKNRILIILIITLTSISLLSQEIQSDHEQRSLLSVKKTIDFDDREEARKALAMLDAGCSILDAG